MQARGALVEAHLRRLFASYRRTWWWDECAIRVGRAGRIRNWYVGNVDRRTRRSSAVTMASFGARVGCCLLTFWCCGIGPKISSMHDTMTCAQPQAVAEINLPRRGKRRTRSSASRPGICRSALRRFKVPPHYTLPLPIADAQSLPSFHHPNDTLVCIVSIFNI